MNWILRHPALASIIATWIFNNVITVLVSSLPAPTKDSTARYVYWFKVLNTIIGNVARAKSTAIEESPNWQAAIDAHVTRHNLVPNSPAASAPPPPEAKS